MLKNIINDQGFNRLVKAKNAYCLYNKNDIYIGKAIEEYGEFSELEADIFRQVCKKDDVVIEVGTNIGTHTQIFSSLVGENGLVLAFEPQFIVFQTLCANLALNSISNVFAYQSAVGEENGSLYIPFLDYNKTNNYGGISLDSVKKGIKVKKEKLDNYLTMINKLKFIKIDVEGMEIDVLKGAKDIISKFKPIMYIENDRIEKSSELIELLFSYGYKLYWHLPKLYNDNNFAYNKEDIFNNLISVNMLCIHKTNKTNVELMVEITDSNIHPMKR